jgi:hypothetical protein
LEVAAEYRAGVMQQLAVVLAAGAFVAELPLPDESFVGLPIVSAPIAEPGDLPRRIQIVAAPFSERLVLRVAAWLEQQGVVAANRVETSLARRRPNPPAHD